MQTDKVILLSLTEVPSKTNNNANGVETAQGESYQKSVVDEEHGVWSSTYGGLSFLSFYVHYIFDYLYNNYQQFLIFLTLFKSFILILTYI